MLMIDFLWLFLTPTQSSLTPTTNVSLDRSSLMVNVSPVNREPTTMRLKKFAPSVPSVSTTLILQNWLAQNVPWSKMWRVSRKLKVPTPSMTVNNAALWVKNTVMKVESVSIVVLASISQKRDSLSVCLVEMDWQPDLELHPLWMSVDQIVSMVSKWVLQESVKFVQWDHIDPETR